MQKITFTGISSETAKQAKRQGKHKAEKLQSPLMLDNEENIPIRKRSTAPLRSWDIFMEGYWKQMALAEDKLALRRMAKKSLWKDDWNMEKLLLKEGKVILVTDPDLHIVFASSNITAMNGYTAAEIVGKTPRIFQGKDTDEMVKVGIRESVMKWEPFHASLINYKKNGEPYHCTIEGFPIFNKQEELVNFIAFETAFNEVY